MGGFWIFFEEKKHYVCAQRVKCSKNRAKRMCTLINFEVLGVKFRVFL